MKMYPTIAEALTLGGIHARRRWRDARLASTDGIRATRSGQTQYPALRVLQTDRARSSRTAGAPCRCSTTSTCRGTGNGRRRCTTRPASMGFPLMAGSSLPVTWRTPSVEMPLGAQDSRGRLRLLRRRRQLRLPRPRDAAVHGRAPPAGRDRRQVDAGVSR